MYGLNDKDSCGKSLAECCGKMLPQQTTSMISKTYSCGKCFAAETPQRIDIIEVIAAENPPLKGERNLPQISLPPGVIGLPGDL